MADLERDDVDTESVFSESYDTEPPVPVESPDTVANSAAGADEMPDGFVDDEHVAEIGDFTVMRAGMDCPRCDSNVFLHPDSVEPSNSVYCFNCSWCPLGIVWWETPRLDAFDQGGEST